MSLSSRLSALGTKLTAALAGINAQLLAKGSTAASDFSQVATKISAIPTGITPTGTLSIEENGTYDVTRYASASVTVGEQEYWTAAGVMYHEIMNIDSVGTSNIPQYAYSNAINMKELYVTGLSPLWGGNTAYAFEFCTALEKAEFDVYGSPGVGFLRYCTALEFVKLGKNESNANNLYTIKANCFIGCSALNTIVLVSNSVCALDNVNALANTPFSNGDGGDLFVPTILQTDYEQATNWSALESINVYTIESSLNTLQEFMDISEFYIIVEQLPTTDISTTKVYLISTGEPNEYNQWYYENAVWNDYSTITLL